MQFSCIVEGGKIRLTVIKPRAIVWRQYDEDNDMILQWDDLEKEEQVALRRMNRGPYPELSQDLAERLIQRGLAERRPTGIGISRAGRELTIDSLLRVS